MPNRIWPVDAVAGSPLYSGRALRQTLMAPLVAGARTGRPLGGRSGVRPGTPTTTVSATSTTWTCGPHAGVLDLQAAAEAGPYGYSVDAAVSGAMTAANQTNPRIDIVYVQLDDPAEGDGTSAPAVTPKYLAGSAGQTPSAPAAPARSMVLAQINVPASGGGAPSVTWVAPYSVAAGGVTPVRSLPATPWGNPDAPELALFNGAIYRGDGATWKSLTPVMPHIRMRKKELQTRSATTWSQIAFEETVDAAGDQPWTTTTGGVITVTQAGLYMFDLTVSMTIAGFACQIRKVGTNDVLDQSPLGTSASQTNHAHATRRLAAGDQVIGLVYPSSAANLTVDNAATPTFMTVTKLSD